MGRWLFSEEESAVPVALSEPAAEIRVGGRTFLDERVKRVQDLALVSH